MHLTHGVPHIRDSLEEQDFADEESDEPFAFHGDLFVPDRHSQVLDFDPHLGARHVSDLLGMHIKHPEELQRAEREAEVAHRYVHHPVTRYDPDQFVPHE